MVEVLIRRTRLLNVFDKVDKVRQVIFEHLPELNEDELIYMLAHCRVYYEGNLYYGRRTADKAEKKRRPERKLTKMESELFQLLLKHKVNPSTCYRWFLASRVPEDIMNEVKRKNMTVSKAIEIARNRKRVKDNKLGWQMVSMIRETIRWI